MNVIQNGIVIKREIETSVPELYMSGVAVTFHITCIC